MSLNGVSYNWNAEEFPERYFDNRTHIGIIAQEVEEVQGLEDLVYTDENGYKSVSYDELIPYCRGGQSLKSENEGLKAGSRLLNHCLKSHKVSPSSGR